MQPYALEEIAAAKSAGKGWTTYRPLREGESFPCNTPVGRLGAGRCPVSAAFVSYSTVLPAVTTMCLQHWLDWSEGPGRCEKFTTRGWRCRILAPCHVHPVGDTHAKK